MPTLNDPVIDAGATALMEHPLLQDDPGMISDRSTCREVVKSIASAMAKASGRTSIDDAIARLIDRITWVEKKADSGLDPEIKHTLIFAMVRADIDPLIEQLNLPMLRSGPRNSYEHEVHTIVSTLSALKERLAPAT